MHTRDGFHKNYRWTNHRIPPDIMMESFQPPQQSPLASSRYVSSPNGRHLRRTQSEGKLLFPSSTAPTFSPSIQPSSSSSIPSISGYVPSPSHIPLVFPGHIISPQKPISLSTSRLPSPPNFNPQVTSSSLFKKPSFSNFAAFVKQKKRNRSSPPTHLDSPQPHDDTSSKRPRQKEKEPCRYFTKMGSCKNGMACPFLHDPLLVDFCPTFLNQGSCSHSSCTLRHGPNINGLMPICPRFLQGTCITSDCPFRHVKESSYSKESFHNPLHSRAQASEARSRLTEVLDSPFRRSVPSSLLPSFTKPLLCTDDNAPCTSSSLSYSDPDLASDDQPANNQYPFSDGYSSEDSRVEDNSYSSSDLESRPDTSPESPPSSPTMPSYDNPNILRAALLREKLLRERNLVFDKGFLSS